MPAFNDFLDLRIAVGDLVDNRNLSDVLPRLTIQAEVMLNRRLRTAWQMKAFAPAWAGNSANLPEDFLQLVEPTNRLWVDGRTIHRRPYHTGPAEIAYYAAVPSITEAPFTNWLLNQFPNAYLYAVAAEASKHLRSAEGAMLFQGQAEQELREIKIEDDRARYSHRSVRVAGFTP